jgi:hypothetical protein
MLRPQHVGGASHRDKRLIIDDSAVLVFKAERFSLLHGIWKT